MCDVVYVLVFEIDIQSNTAFYLPFNPNLPLLLSKQTYISIIILMFEGNWLEYPLVLDLNSHPTNHITLRMMFNSSISTFVELDSIN